MSCIVAGGGGNIGENLRGKDQEYGTRHIAVQGFLRGNTLLLFSPTDFLSSSELHITDLVHIRFTSQRTDEYIGPNWPIQSILRSFYLTVSNQLRITENKGKYRLHKMLPKANAPPEGIRPIARDQE